MRKKVLSAAAMVALIATTAVGIAVAAGDEGPETVKVGDLEMTVDVNFQPKSGPKKKQTPLKIDMSGGFAEADGGRPPAIREFVLEADKNGEVHTKGIPVCRPGELQATSTATALKNCRGALIGEGTVVAQVAFAEQRPIDVRSKLLLFNGGEKGGKTTWYAHTYFANPVSGAIVATATIRKIHRGRYGTEVVVKIPRLLGGFGSGISFQVEIFKFVKVGDRQINPISGTCLDGKVKFHMTANFEDGTRAAAEFIHGCVGR